MRDGKFKFSDRASYEAYMAKFKDGTEMELTIGPKYKRRTQGAPGEITNFNGYYWGVIVRMISDEVGEPDDNATHYILQMLFNRRGVQVFDPETNAMKNIEIPKGTRDMSGMEFGEYCSKIRMWAAMPGNLCEHGMRIPEPNEADFDI